MDLETPTDIVDVIAARNRKAIPILDSFTPYEDIFQNIPDDSRLFLIKIKNSAGKYEVKLIRASPGGVMPDLNSRLTYKTLKERLRKSYGTVLEEKVYCLKKLASTITIYDTFYSVIRGTTSEQLESAFDKTGIHSLNVQISAYAAGKGIIVNPTVKTVPDLRTIYVALSLYMKGVPPENIRKETSDIRKNSDNPLHEKYENMGYIRLTFGDYGDCFYAYGFSDETDATFLSIISMLSYVFKNITGSDIEYSELKKPSNKYLKCNSDQIYYQNRCVNPHTLPDGSLSVVRTKGGDGQYHMMVVDESMMNKLKEFGIRVSKASKSGLLSSQFKSVKPPLSPEKPSITFDDTPEGYESEYESDEEDEEPMFRDKGKEPEYPSDDEEGGDEAIGEDNGPEYTSEEEEESDEEYGEGPIDSESILESIRKCVQRNKLG